MAYTDGAEAHRRSFAFQERSCVYVTCPSSSAYMSVYSILLYSTVLSGHTLIIGVPPEGVPSVINRYKPAFFFTYANVLCEVVYHPKEPIDWSGTAVIFSVGATIPPNLAADVKRLLNKALFGGWAMTETGAGGLMNDQSRGGLISNGPSTLIDLAIVDPESGTLCPRGEA